MIQNNSSDRQFPVPSQDEVDVFCEAAKAGRYTDVKAFLDTYGTAFVDAKSSSYGMSALLYAAWKGHKDTAVLLLESGAAIDQIGFQKKTPLAWAAYGGNREVVEILLDKGACISAVDSHGWTPKQLALIKGSADVIDTLGRWPEIKKQRDEQKRLQEIREKNADAAAAAEKDRVKLKQLRPSGSVLRKQP